MAEDTIHKEFEALKRDFNKLRTDLVDLTEALRAAGVEKIAGAKANLDEEIDKRRESLRSALKGARVRGEQAVDEMEQGVASHPLSSLFMAFGLGFIIAKLLDGGRH